MRVDPRLALLATHPASPPAVLHALASTDPNPTTVLLAATHPAATPDVARAATARFGRGPVDVADKVDVARALLPPHSPRGIPEVADQIPVIAAAALTADTATGPEWRWWWDRLVATEDLPHDLRLAAAEQSLRVRGTHGHDFEAIIALAATDPTGAARLAAACLDPDAARLLRAAAHRRTVTLDDEDLTFPGIATARGPLLSAGPAATDLARRILAGDASSSVITAIALTPNVAEPVRAQAVRRVRHSDLHIIVDVAVAARTTELVCAVAARTEANPLDACRGEAHLPDGLAAEALRAGLPYVDLVELACHPDTTPADRALAARLAAGLATTQTDVDAAMLRAGQLLPDLAAAGAQIPWPAVRWRTPGLARCVRPALEPTLRAAHTPTAARALVHLAADFNGTVADLAAAFHVITA